MNKKIISSLLALVLLIVTIVPTISSVAAIGNSRNMIIGTAEGYRGDNVNINVTLENNPGFSTASIKIDYDAERINLDSAELCGEFASGANVSYDNLPYLTFVKNNDSTDSLFLTLSFKILENAEIGNVPISILYDEGDISNKAEEDVNFEVIPGGIDIMAKPVSVTGVSLDKNTLSIKTGESETLNATVSPDDATNKNLTWKSSDESVVTVDADGKMTGIKKGTAIVTVTTEDGGFTDSCTVNVECAHKVTTTYPAKASTCNTHGNSEYVICNDCGIIVSGSNAELPYANHNYVNNEQPEYLKNDGTCVSKAVYYKSCSYCGLKGTDTFEGENFNHRNHVGGTYVTNQKNATCTDKGYTGDIHCSSCDVVINTGNAIPASNHKAGNWTVTTAPTCVAPGEEVQKCTDCGVTIATRTVPATGHT
ncbi:MAG: Ig-like domain-containing protein, partial [Acetobacter sp.]|nr:Ig-like domain-containing protein [Acetobacter sp.]